MKNETKLLIAELEIKQAKQQKALTATRYKIEDIKDKELLPDLKKKYEGKYWKYRNSAGGDTDKWWLYSYCKEVKSVYNFIYVCFEITPYTHEFKINETCGDFLCQIQITKAEYNRAAKSFIKKAQKILTQ